ncbi:MAG: hypothetical protein ABJQ29_15365 [Luteolibacter sp.]
MNGKTLLLALVLIAAVALLLIYMPSGGGVSAGADRSNEKAGAMDTGGAAGGRATDDKDSDLVEEIFDVSRENGKAREERNTDGDTAAVRERLREMQRRDDEGLEMITLPDGHQSIDLKGRFQHVTQLVVAEDGTVVPVCGGHFPDPGEVPGE